MTLDAYTDQQLMDELLERRLEREQEDVPKPWCDECRHFKAWKKRGDPPDTYNPCSKSLVMRFHFPEPWEDPHEAGYFRRNCSDRAEIPPKPKPKQPPEPPEPPRDGRPDWHLTRKR